MKKNLLVIIFVSICLFTNAQWYTNWPQSANSSLSDLTANQTRVFAATDSAVYYSPDGGSTWSLSKQGLDNTRYILGIATKGDKVFISTGNGVYISNDNGDSWAPSGLQGRNMEIVSVIGNAVYTSTIDKALYRSVDNGTTWQLADTGKFIWQLAAKGNDVYAGGEGGLYVLYNGDNNFTHLDMGNDNENVVLVAIKDSLIFAATSYKLYVSTNNGAHWNVSYTPTSEGDGLSTVVFGDGKTVFAGTDEGVKLSTDNGFSWLDITANLPEIFISTMVIQGTTLFILDDNKGVWQRSIADYVSGLPQTGKAEKAFSIYPNPTNNQVIIESNFNGTLQLQITDLTGQLVLTQPVERTKTVISTTNLSAGIYMVTIKGAEGSATQKLVVTK